MTKKLYVGNLGYTVTSRELEAMFAAHGAVTSANLIKDYDTGRSKGFGFVEMNDAKEAEAAIAALHGKDIDGRNLIVNEARPRASRPDGFGGNGAGGFGGGRRN